MGDRSPELARYETATRRWIVEVVVGLGLCPFAGEPLEAVLLWTVGLRR